MRKALTLFLLLCAAGFLRAQEEQVLFSAGGGFYESSFQLSLGCIYPNHHIRYTTNGNRPTMQSHLYEDSLTLGSLLFSHSNIFTIQISPDDLVYVPDSVRHAIVIRAAVFDENDSCISNTVTNTYLFPNMTGYGSNMPLVCVCADSLALFDYETGIFVPGIHFSPENPEHTGNYYLKGNDWERLANVEFYEPSDNSGINQACGLRTHGNLTRRHPAKGMKIYAREEYGKKRFQHAFFPNESITSYKHLVLKPFAVFSPHSGIQDYFCATTAVQLGLPAPHCRPVILYLNGEYWGVYFIQEKMDERYLEDHYGVDPDNCNIISNWMGEVDHGNNISFCQMLNWFRNTDLSNLSAYEHACELIDINNFIDYYVLETFIGNWDWPGNNMRCYQEGNGPWRWIFFDGDATLMGSSNPFINAAVYEPPQTWINYPEAKLFFGKLMENSQFRERFRNRAFELCSSLFQYENTYPVFYDMQETLRPMIPDQRLRFGYPSSDATWENGNAVINDYLAHRTQNYLSLIDVYLQQVDLNESNIGNNAFICFPNPANETIYIQRTGQETSETELYIYDVRGALVFKEHLPAYSIWNTSSIHPILSKGLYFIKIDNSTQYIIIQ